MKLLIYSHAFAPNVGGVETIVLSLARALSALRTPQDLPQFEVLLVTETPARDYDDSGLPFSVVRQPSPIKLWRIIRSSDVIHVAGASLLPALFAWLSHKPYVIEHHGYQAICPNGLLLHQPDHSVCPGHFLAGNYGECQKCVAREGSYFRSWINLLLMFPRHFLATRASANIAITEHVLKRCGLPRSSVFYYGIGDLFVGRSPVEAVAALSNEICFLFVGRLVAEKGVPVLLEAARLLRDEGLLFNVRLIGDGPERSKLEAIIARDQLQSRVKIVGFLTGADLAETVRDARAVVMPSIWEETAGLSAIEQMMRGQLVIASDIGGLGEIVEGAGMKFPPGDSQALADVMRSVILQPGLIDSFGVRAREKALRVFFRENMVAQHASVYLSLCPNSPTKSRNKLTRLLK